MSKSSSNSFSLFSYLLVFLFLGYLLTEGSLLRLLSRENDEKTVHLKVSSESLQTNPSPSLRKQTITELDAASELRYCNSGKVVGSEGPVFEGSSDYVLHYLLLNIRHGDRSSIHNIPGAQPLSSQLTNKKKLYLDSGAFKYLTMLSSFILKSVDESQPNISLINGEDDVLLDALNASEVFAQPDSQVLPGILTTRGFMQHIMLGKHLSKAYMFYMKTLTSPQDLYIRSTNYRRTILSVVALMITLVPTLHQHVNQKIPIYYYPRESDEIMHGVGLRLSSHAKGEEETSNHGSCERSAYLAAQEKANFKPDKANTIRLQRIFGDSIQHMMATDIVDSSYPRECHHLPFPCASDGVNCMSRNVFLMAREDANRQFCDRYTGRNGGMNATRLSIYPFLKEIRDTLLSSVTATRKSKITIFSGHDTVIAPVLAGLGIYQRQDLCVWPPYASRIAFEVYVKNESPIRTIYDEKDARELVMIRILYNGEDVTRSVPTCNTISRGTSHLCPLGAFEAQINSLISPYNSMDDACKL